MHAEIAMKRIEAIPELSKSGRKLNGLFRLLTCRDLWYRAYEKIAPNKGSMTPGVDGASFDGVSLEKIDNIIVKVLTGQYEPKPVRRVYIPKPNGKLRPLGVPTVADRLVQEVVRSILETIYEPVFSTCSHGFRPGRSCHTALKQITDIWHGVKWFVEADIKGFFDNIDHETMMNLLAKKIDDKRFLRLVHSFLKAGYLEDWTYHETFSGTPQGGVVSPILANIYLHELDKFMHKWIMDHDRGTGRASNPEYERVKTALYRLRKKLASVKDTATEEEVARLEGAIALTKAKQLSIPSMDLMDPHYRRYRYCRYADDFLVGVIGSKRDAEEMMAAVRSHLSSLKLEVSEEKSGVRHTTEGTMFLGYEVGTYTPGRTRWVPVLKDGKTIRRAATGQVYLGVPRDKVRKFCQSKWYGDFDTMQSTHRKDMLNSSEVEIVAQYNAEFRGFAQYYALAGNVKTALSKLQYVEQGSLLATLAAKHQTSRVKVIRQIKGPDGEWYGTTFRKEEKPLRAKVWKLKHLAKPNQRDAGIDEPKKGNLARSRTDVVDRLLAKECSNCGVTDRPIEVHHVRKLADHNEKKDFVLFIKAARTRKQIALCTDCHDDLHAGRLQDFRARMKQEVESRVR